jgi:hypothetical protein
MDSGHMYHLFVVKDTSEVLSNSKSEKQMIEWESHHQYMGSTKASLGRPTSELMSDVLSDWSEHCK